MKNILIVIFFMVASFKNYAQDTYTPSPENVNARKWFDSARFGMFIIGALPAFWVMANG